MAAFRSTVSKIIDVPKQIRQSYIVYSLVLPWVNKLSGFPPPKGPKCKRLANSAAEKEDVFLLLTASETATGPANLAGIR